MKNAWRKALACLASDQSVLFNVQLPDETLL